MHIPCILYNVPGRTGCSIPVSVVERLAKHPNIAGIKEASGDMSYAMKIAHCVGPDFALYSGNDDITVPLMSIGGSGVISVYANVMPRDVPRDRGGLPGRQPGPGRGQPPEVPAS